MRLEIAHFALICLFGTCVLFGQEQESGDVNINSRYTIESVNFIDQQGYKLSTSSLDEIRHLVGSKVSTDTLDRLAARIRGELGAHDVTFKLARGAAPDSVRVLIQVDGAGASVDASIPVLRYDSAVGFTGAGELTTTVGPNAFTFRMIRDSGDLIEQFSGLEAKYSRTLTASGHISVGFQFGAYEDQYAGATLTALESDSRPSSLGAGPYGSRLDFEPSATFVLFSPLTLSVGFSFEQLNGLPSLPRSESANAFTSTLHFHQRSRRSMDDHSDLDAVYGVRAATGLLGTDLAYTRHLARLKYNYTSRTQSVEVLAMTGAIYGQAPLFERFALGNATLLRGWNQYELDPLGGNRLAYGSVTYGYRRMRVFYDAGSVWDQGKAPEPKQSAGVGVSSGLGVLDKGAFLVAMAFPLRQGRVTPVLIAGMNF